MKAIDITENFGYKSATYVSPITKATTSINISRVEIRIGGHSSISNTKICNCVIISDKNNWYPLDELRFDNEF